MANTKIVTLVDEYLPGEFRRYIESNFYSQINKKATLEQVLQDNSFIEAPTSHVALFADHGTVHVGDISSQILQVLNRINGILIPEREHQRLKFMGGYGVMVAYLHDIGMMNFSAKGRVMHPEYAAQLVYTPEFDSLLKLLWDTNSGNVAWRLLNLSLKNILEQEPLLILREILSLSLCHSKSKIPIEKLNDRKQLRQVIQYSLRSDLDYLYHQQQISKLKAELEQNPGENRGKLKEKLKQFLTEQEDYSNSSVGKDPVNHDLDRFYPDFEKGSFTWLKSEVPAVLEFTHDIIDTLRCLRCSDALRQRGTLLKTSAAYDILVDPTSANAVYALRAKNDAKVFFIEAKAPISAGEANLASSELDSDCNLRISFHRGAFSSPEGIQWAAYSLALIIDDIQADVIRSFSRNGVSPESNLPSPRLDPTDIQILIEGNDDNPRFARLVCEELNKLNPLIGRRSRPAPSLKNTNPMELQHYLGGNSINWSREKRYTILRKVFGDATEETENIDLDKAFEDIRLKTLHEDDILFNAGNPAGFVYLPFDPGLYSFPLGGYTSLACPPWVPIGTTGVIRGGVRNATVVAKSRVDVLIITKQNYMEHWYIAYNQEKIPDLFHNVNPILLWDDKYCVHIDIVDKQHKELFTIYGELATAMEADKSEEVLKSIFDKLLEYTETHFRDEESAQKEIGYPGYQEHKKMHISFINEINKFSQQFASGKSISIKISMFIRNWLLHHIADVDNDIRCFMETRGNSENEVV